jgi:hypothetical protein
MLDGFCCSSAGVDSGARCAAAVVDCGLAPTSLSHSLSAVRVSPVTVVRPNVLTGVLVAVDSSVHCRETVVNLSVHRPVDGAVWQLFRRP